MTATAQKQKPYYDKNRPASTGRWVSVHRHSNNYVELRTHQTEFDANQAMGIRGGNQDPRYVPERS